MERQQQKARAKAIRTLPRFSWKAEDAHLKQQGSSAVWPWSSLEPMSAAQQQWQGQASCDKAALGKLHFLILHLIEHIGHAFSPQTRWLGSAHAQFPCFKWMTGQVPCSTLNTLQVTPCTTGGGIVQQLSTCCKAQLGRCKLGRNKLGRCSSSVRKQFGSDISSQHIGMY